MSRPTISPSFATASTFPAGASPWSGQPPRVDPSAGVRTQGLTPQTDLPAEYLNFLIGIHGDWINYLDVEATGVVGGTISVAALQVDGAGGATVSNNNPGHICFSGTTPTVAADVGAGTSPTISITGSDVRGKLSLTAGTSPAANSAALIITFANAFTGFYGGPYVYLQPTNRNAASIVIYADKTGTAPNLKATVNVGSAALTAGQAYTWNYWVTE